MRYNFVILGIYHPDVIYKSGSKMVIFRSQNRSISQKSYGNIALEKYTAPRPLRPIVNNNYKRRLLLMVFTTDVPTAATAEEI
jgi:hypothetical protein